MVQLDKSKIRGELIRLKTDIEEQISPNDPAQIGMEEAFYRGNVEKALEDMENCHFKNVLSDLELMDISRGFLIRYDSQRRFPKIQDMLIKALIEIANESCQCKFYEKE